MPYADAMNKTLVFAIFDFDRFSKHDQIGEVKVPLCQIDLAQTIEEWRELQSVEGEGGQVISQLIHSVVYSPVFASQSELCFTPSSDHWMLAQNLLSISSTFTILIIIIIIINGLLLHNNISSQLQVILRRFFEFLFMRSFHIYQVRDFYKTRRKLSFYVRI